MMIAAAERSGMMPMDVWWAVFINNGRALSWQANISLQLSKAGVCLREVWGRGWIL